MSRLDKIGLSYCINELRLAGKKASPVEENANKNWHIEVFDEAAKKILYLQVKTLDWDAETDGKVRVNFIANDLHYLVIVLLNYKGEEFSAFIIPRSKLKQKGQGDFFKLIDDDKCVYYASRTDQEQHTYQVIDIAPLRHDDMRAKFACYRNAFAAIKSSSPEKVT